MHEGEGEGGRESRRARGGMDAGDIGDVGGGDLCCGRTWSATWTEACFRKCRCGSQAAPYEIISILRRAEGSGGADGEGEGRGREGERKRLREVKRGSRRKASRGVGKIAARLQELLEKLIIFPVS